MIIYKIGIILSSFLFFFFAFFLVQDSLAKSKKRKEEGPEEYDQFGKKDEEILEPGLEKLSEKARKKYLLFKEVLPIIKYPQYRLLTLVLAIIFFFVFTLGINFVFGLVALIISIFLPDTIAKHIVEKRINKFELQLVDGISLIANALKAGTSFTQAVEVMIKEMKPPLSHEFATLLKETRMGASIDQALENLGKRINSEELKIVVVSVNIARQAGGNLSEILLHIGDTIRERERIKGKIDSLTAQGRLSGIVIGAMPILLAFALNQIDPLMMKPLFQTFIGQLVFLVVFIMELIGFLWIMKIIKIDI